MTADLPPGAITAAALVLISRFCDQWSPQEFRDKCTQAAADMVEAAAPHLAAAERERAIADFDRFLRGEMTETIIANAVRDGMKAERERIRQLAIEREAWYHKGRGAYRHPFADLLAGDQP
jgi:hypothetical protein